MYRSYISSINHYLSSAICSLLYFSATCEADRQAIGTRNVRAYVWTIDDTWEMKRLIEMGMDGIITDHPDRLMTLLKPGRLDLSKH